MTGAAVGFTVAGYTVPGLSVAGLDPIAGGLVAQLLRASLEGALAVGLVLLLVRALPTMPARLRCLLWWAACLKLVVGLAWVAPLELPWLPPAAASVPGLGAAAGESASGPVADATTHPNRRPAARLPGETPQPGPGPSGGEAWPTALPAPEVTAGAGPPAAGSRGVHLPAGSGSVGAVAAGLLWLAGLALATCGAARRHARLARVIGAASPVTDSALLDRLAQLARRFRVAPPPVLVSADIDSPQVVGVVRPRLLLPPAAARAGHALDLVLAHELAHLRRRDLLLGWVPALARGLFFFHPLAALAAREYSLAREAACDAEVLHRLDAAPRDYGRVLLTWGAVRHGGLPAAALGDHRQLKRRLIMLESSSNDTRRRRPWLALAALLPVALLLLPVRLVAAPEMAPAAAPTPSAAVRSTPGPARGDEAVHRSDRGNVDSPAIAPLPPTPAAPAVPAAIDAPTPPAAPPAPVVDPPPAPAPPAAPAAEGHSWVWSSDDDGEPMVYLEGDRSIGFHSSSLDQDQVRKLRRDDEALLWFVRDGQEYVIRDPALLARFRKAWQPVMELGKQQGELGRQQGELGREQGELGREQGQLGAAQGRLGAQQARLSAEIAAVAARRVALEMDDADEAALEPLERQVETLEAQMEALAETQEELAEQQEPLAEKQRALAEKQRPLAEQQRELAERQRGASEAARDTLDGILDEALRTGEAEPVD